ncbi:hypothetical protein [Gymnodinialimonas ulvae]|uniref:hypothetical protein n=1 Tax=Gymnodinialimonas ulvae TaxID=3126504 RepID=UPI0030AD9A84
MIKFSQPFVALPVPSVVEAQGWYRDRLGFEVRWHNKGGRIGGVPHGEAAVFLPEIEGEDPAQ